jgi:hypothetical protein
VHEVAHAPFAHPYGSHDAIVVAPAQLPLPSHACPTTSLPEQTFAPHEVPADAATMPAHDARVTPSQTVFSQAVPPAHAVRAPCGAPMTATHAPSAPGVSHASHSPEHADPQQ